MEMRVNFRGGLEVAAEFKGFQVLTDQPPAVGGQSAGPSPYDLCLASLGTCAGFYALRFCQERGIGTEGLELQLSTLKEPEGGLAAIQIQVLLPDGFPEKYRRPILRAVDHCAVKRLILAPPPIDVVALTRAEQVAGELVREAV